MTMITSRRRTLAEVSALIRGVSPVLEVPFTDDGELAVDDFARVVRYVLDSGVSSVMFPGFAGEFYKLAEDERRLLTELLIKEARDFERRVAKPFGSPASSANGHAFVAGVAVIAAVQDHATRLAVRRARWSVEAGADAINLLPPHLLAPSAAAIDAHLRAVLAAVPDTPVVLQFAPTETGTSLDPRGLAGLVRDHPNLTLVKVESSPPGPYIAALGRLDPPIPAVEGYAGVQLPDAFRRGCVGTQPGCSFIEIYQEIWGRFAVGDLVGGDRLHARLLPYISYWMLDTERIIATEKMISFRRGLISSPHCRSPRHELDREDLAMIDRFLADFDDLLPALG